MILWLLLIASPDPIALRLEEVGELPLARGIAIANALSDAIKSRTGRPAVLDEPSWACESADRCIPEIAARTRATSVVLLRVFGGATLIHVHAERTDVLVTLDLEVKVDGSDWPAAFGEASKTMFPEAPAIAVVPEQRPVVEAPLPILPIVLAGSAVLLASVGVGFGVSSRGAASDIEAEPLHGGQYQALADRQEAHAIVADACFIGAGGALIGAIVTWIAEP